MDSLKNGSVVRSLSTRDFFVNGRLIKVGSLRSEWYNEVVDPLAVVQAVKAARIPLDVFSFIQRPPHVTPSFPFHMEMDHMAAIPISTFNNWWENQVIKKIRKNVRRSEKHGITVESVPFDERLIKGIQRIYAEVPLRGGRPFKHYNDDFEACKRKHESYSDRSDFIAAFYQNEIIGFIKLVYAGSTARTMQNISMDKYRDFSPSNALLAKSVQICAERGITQLVFGKLAYGKKGNDGLEEFKLANGFVRLEFPRYYIPLSRRGELAIKFKLYHDLSDFFPKGVVKLVRDIRGSWYHLRYGKHKNAAVNSEAG